MCAHPTWGPYQSISRYGWSKCSSSSTKTALRGAGRQTYRWNLTTHGGAIHDFGGSNQSPHYQIFKHWWSQWDGIGDSSIKHRTHKGQHCVQAHANQWGNKFKLNISKFQGDLQPKEFMDWVLAVEEVLEFNGVPDEWRVSLVVHTFRGRFVSWWQ